MLSLPSAAGAATLGKTVSIAGTYTLAPDGTFWTTSGSGCGGGGGTFSHYDDDGNDLGDTFTTTVPYSPLEIAASNNRVYTVNYCGSSDPYILSFQSNGTGQNPGSVSSDVQSGQRFDAEGVRLLGGTLAIVGASKFTLADPTNLSTTHPFYPYQVFGAGILTNPPHSEAQWESCEGVINETPDVSCRHTGKFGTGLQYVTGAEDVAAGPGGSFFVLQSYCCPQARVTVVEPHPITGGLVPTLTFGDTSQGDLGSDDVPSMVRDPNSGNLFIADSANRRISEFNTAGVRLRSFGFGVSPGGTDDFEACVPEESPGCQDGVPTNVNAASYFSQLDIGPDGTLWAEQPLLSRIQAIDIGGGSPLDETARISAKPTKVKKNKKTTLTATTGPCGTSNADTALFQVRDGAGFDNLGSAKAIDGDCKAKTKVKITRKSVFQVLSIDSAQNTLATSPKVTVKLK